MYLSNSIYINDIPLHNRSRTRHSLLFADDLENMHIFAKINQTVINQINKQLANLETWLNNSRLIMAPEKFIQAIFSNNFKAGDDGKKGFKIA